MAEFFLGTHKPHWLGLPAFRDVPLFVSHNTLRVKTELPRAMTDWAEDSGGFMQLNLHGRWVVGVDEYVANVRRHREEIGRLRWAAIQDWMCEPFILKKTGLSLAEHQWRTVQSYETLLERAPEVPWAPVLQGWQKDDYLRCLDLYSSRGHDLMKAPVVGVGSICRRQHTAEAEDILATLAGLGLELHGFGFKTRGLLRVSKVLKSADSMAWSFNARRNPPLPGHTHKSCANCAEWALRWRGNLLSKLWSPIGDLL